MVITSLLVVVLMFVAYSQLGILRTQKFLDEDCVEDVDCGHEKLKCSTEKKCAPVDSSLGNTNSNATSCKSICNNLTIDANACNCAVSELNCLNVCPGCPPTDTSETTGTPLKTLASGDKVICPTGYDTISFSAIPNVCTEKTSIYQGVDNYKCNMCWGSGLPTSYKKKGVATPWPETNAKLSFGSIPTVNGFIKCNTGKKGDLLALAPDQKNVGYYNYYATNGLDVSC